MRRHPRGQALMAFHDGELDPGMAEAVAAHAAGCGRCRARLAEFARIGAAVRAELPAPAVVQARLWHPPTPMLTRVLPALAALVAVVLGIVATDPPERRGQQVAARNGLPTTIIPAPQDATPSPAPDSTTPSSTSITTGPRRPAAAPPTRRTDNVIAVEKPERPPTLRLGILVPGAQPADPVVAAVQRVLDQVNQAGGIGGATVSLVVDDATRPGGVRRLADRGVRALVGGYGTDPSEALAAAAEGLAWFGPADLVEAAAPVVPIEIPHRAAGALLAHQLLRQGDARAFAVIATSPERQLAEGVRDAMPLSSSPLGPEGSCEGALKAAVMSRADVLVLALSPDAVARCVSDLPDGFPIHDVVVPVTAVDALLALGPRGVALHAVLGAPDPLQEGDAGVRRFEQATGKAPGYRALVSFAAAEVAVRALRTDTQDPFRGFRSAGVYRSDLVTLDPARTPPNVAAQPVVVGETSKVDAGAAS